MPVPKNVKKPTDHRSKVTGKVFTWLTEDDATITIPLRINMEVLESMGGGEMDAAEMFKMIGKIAPDQMDTIRVTDINDFVSCFTAWQDAYNTATGASLGESSASSAS